MRNPGAGTTLSKNFKSSQYEAVIKLKNGAAFPVLDFLNSWSVLLSTGIYYRIRKEM